MSETLRRPYGHFENSLGPNMKQSKEVMPKKNYHLNMVKRWV